MDAQDLAARRQRQYELCKEILSRPQRRPNVQSNEEIIDSSEIVAPVKYSMVDVSGSAMEDKTLSIDSTPSKCSFEPEEISGRSTLAGNSKYATPGLREIMEQSVSDNVREMWQKTFAGTENRHHSFAGDKSPAYTDSFRWGKAGSISYSGNFNFSNEKFVSGDKMKSKLLEDEFEWEKEFATIPSAEKGASSKKPTTPVVKPKVVTINAEYLNFTDFSGILPPSTANESNDASKFSIGAYFMKNSADVRSMVPNVSPPKHDPVPLIDATLGTEDSCLRKDETEQDDKENSHRQPVSNKSADMGAVVKALRTFNIDDTPNTRIRKVFSVYNEHTAAAVMTSEAPQVQISQQVSTYSPPVNEFSDTASFRQSIMASEELEKIDTMTTTETGDTCSIRRTPSKKLLGKSYSRSCVDVSSSKFSPSPSKKPVSLKSSPRNATKITSSQSVASRLDRSDESEQQQMLMGSKSPRSVGKLSLPTYALTRASSQCSSNSEFNHREGILPLKSTHGEVSWSSVKLRQRARKTIQIKNYSDKRLSLRIEISGPGYQLSGYESGTVVLQSLECRSIAVDFCPTVIGPAIGCLKFYSPIDPNVNRTVRLYGYGGEAKIRVMGVCQGPVGLPFFQMGNITDLKSSSPLEKVFTLTNRGNLTAFATIAVEAKNLEYVLPSSVLITPNRVLIPAGVTIKVSVKYRPRREELRKLFKAPSPVITLTHLQIVTGDDPTRLRMRKCIEQARQQLTAVPEEMSNPMFDCAINMYKEDKLPAQIEVFNDHPTEAIIDLLSSFHHIEIALTLDRAMDETMLETSVLSESALLFKSLTDVSLVEATNNKIATPLTASPERLEMAPSKVEEIRLHNTSSRTQMFEMDANFRHLFKFSPDEGQLLPGQLFSVQVQMMFGVIPSQQLQILVLTERAKLIIPVDVHRRF